MPINFPTSLDDLTNPLSTDPLDTPSHSGQHSDLNDIVEALEAKVGINASADTASIDYIINNDLLKLIGGTMQGDIDLDNFNINNGGTINASSSFVSGVLSMSGGSGIVVSSGGLYLEGDSGFTVNNNGQNIIVSTSSVLDFADPDTGANSVRLSATETQFNRGQAPVDFRIYGDTASRSIFYDESAGTLQFASDTAITKVIVSNSAVTGDAQITFNLGSDLYSIGVDDSASDVLTIAGGGALDTSNIMTLTTGAIEVTPKTTFNNGLVISQSIFRMPASPFPKDDTTPDVRKGCFFTTNSTMPIGITTFDSGTSGDRILILATNNNTTFVDGATLQLAGGANFNIQTNSTIQFILNGTVWYEISRSVN